MIPVNFVSRVDFPTEGNPIIPTLASPDFDTSNPSPVTFLPPDGYINYLFNLASFALSRPT